MHPNKFIKNRSGIYGIRNLVNGKIYVGKTACLYRRCGQYKYDFKTRRLNHLNCYLIRSISAHGIENFEFFPLEFCGHDDLAERELYWMRELGSTDRRRGYNLRMDSSSGMITHSETRERMSENLRAQWAAGVRSNHGEKLKAAWADATVERRVQQAERMRSLRTKFEYEIRFPDGSTEVCDFRRLCELGLKSAPSSFARKRTDRVMIKGVQLTRRPIGEPDHV